MHAHLGALPPQSVAAVQVCQPARHARRGHEGQTRRQRQHRGLAQAGLECESNQGTCARRQPPAARPASAHSSDVVHTARHTCAASQVTPMARCDRRRSPRRLPTLVTDNRANCTYACMHRGWWCALAIMPVSAAHPLSQGAGRYCARQVPAAAAESARRHGPRVEGAAHRQQEQGPVPQRRPDVQGGDGGQPVRAGTM